MRHLAKATVIATVCIGTTLGGCATTPTRGGSVAADMAAITEFNRRYLQAINNGDITALSSLTAEDHIMLAPNRPPLAGKEANDAANRRGFQRFHIDEAWTPLETVVSGDLAYQRGTFTVALTPNDGGAKVHSSGNFLRIYRRRPDGSWQMTRDVLNSDVPPGSTAAAAAE
ncbi:MAG: nuclear transport factor 2 family protein [Gammaproteobacteria bacterium]